MDWKKIGLFAGGILMGSYGVRILSSRDAKCAYTHTTAAVLRMKDTVMKDVTTIRENVEDIAAAAKDINEERQKEYHGNQYESAVTSNLTEVQKNEGETAEIMAKKMGISKNTLI